MGNSSTQNKSGQTNASTANPAWANVGSGAYNQQNKLLQTAPIAAFNQTLAQGGQGKATQDAITSLQGNSGAANKYLTQYANGSMLNGSPELGNIIDQSNQKVADQVNQAMSAAGRYGSGVAQGTLADSIAKNTSNLLYQNYNQQQQNQLNAANSLESAQQNRATGAAGLENQGFSNVMSMIGALPTIQNNKTYDANQQMGLGNQLDTASQNQLNDLINQWKSTDMSDWARLGGLLSAGTQSAGSYGTQTATQKQPANVLGALGALFSAL